MLLFKAQHFTDFAIGKQGFMLLQLALTRPRDVRALQALFLAY